MKSFSISQYLDVDCALRNPNPGILLALVQETRGRVCTTGCADYNGGKCMSYQKLITTFTGEGADIVGEPHPFDTRKDPYKNSVGSVRVRTTLMAPIAPSFKKIEYTETVAEEMARTGLSKSEVRRRRNAAANAI